MGVHVVVVVYVGVLSTHLPIHNIVMVRVKHRYCLGQIHWSDGGLCGKDFDGRKILKYVKDSILLNFGDFGYGSIVNNPSFSLKYYNQLTGMFLIRCSREYSRSLWGALTFINIMDERICKICVIHLGGTIKGCQNVLVKYNKSIITYLHQTCTNATLDLQSVIKGNEMEINEITA